MSTSSQSPPEAPSPGSHYQPSLPVVLIILVLFVGATYVMLHSPVALKATPSATTHSGPVTTIKKSPGSATSVQPKAQVRVQVANGTTTPGLARTFTQQLLTAGWDTLPPLNAAKVNSTMVFYNPGYLGAAREIASSLHATSAVQPLNGLNPVAGSASDNVIVILGPDAAAQG